MSASRLMLVCSLTVLSACGSTPPAGSGGGSGGGGGESACTSGQTRCGTTCVALSTSGSNCGACGNVCDAASLCVAGTCLPTDCANANCADGQICSAGGCLERACVGVVCAVGSACVGGSCVPESCGLTTCTAGFACVSNQCVDAQCSGVVCAGSDVCQLGRCVSGAGGGGGATGGGGGAAGGGGGAATGGGGGAATGGGGGAASGGGGGSVTPVIILSATLNGMSQTTFPNSQQIFGAVSGLTATNTQSCVEVVGVTDGACANPPTGWTTLPNADWVYDGTSQLWRATFAPFAFPPNQYRLFVRNLTTGTQAVPVVLNLTGPKIIFSATLDGTAQTTFRLSDLIYARITGLSATNAQVCIQAQGSPLCNNLANWTTYPAPGWTYDTAAGAWRSSFTASAYPAGSYENFARNTQDLSRAAMVLLTLTAPVCGWSAAVFGSATPPATACTSANAGATAFSDGYTWTCVCN